MKLLFAILIFASVNVQAKTVKIDLSRVSVSQAISSVYDQLDGGNYVLDPLLVADDRMVTFRFANEQVRLKPFLKQLLSSFGYSLETVEKTDFIKKNTTGEGAQDVFVYMPKNRSVAYLTRNLAPLFVGSFANQRSVSSNQKSKGDAPEGSATALLDQTSDTLIFSGSLLEHEKLKKLLSQVDIASSSIEVRGAIIEVSSSQTDTSALSIIAKALDGKFEFNVGAPQSGSLLSFRSPDFSLILNSLATNSDFKMISKPFVSVESGETARLTVGDEVPTLGSITYSENGDPIQSVEYRSSGVIFQITPTVFDDTISINLDQELSSFRPTITGVNASPTLSKRSLSTSVTLKQDQVVVIGGLTDSQLNKSEGRSFFSFLTSADKTSRSSELVLVLTARKI